MIPTKRAQRKAFAAFYWGLQVSEERIEFERNNVVEPWFNIAWTTWQRATHWALSPHTQRSTTK